MSTDAGSRWALVKIEEKDAASSNDFRDIVAKTIDLLDELKGIEKRMRLDADHSLCVANRNLESATSSTKRTVGMLWQVEEARHRFDEAAGELDGLDGVKASLAASACCILLRDKTGVAFHREKARRRLVGSRERLLSVMSKKNVAASIGGVAAGGATLWGIASAVAATGIGLVPVGLVAVATLGAAAGVAEKIAPESPELAEMERLGRTIFGSDVFDDGT